MQVITPEIAALVRQQVEGAPDTDKVIFEGVRVPRAEANAEIERRQVESRNTYFDPQDAVGELANPHLKYRVRSSMAWSLDTACINKARGLFYALRSAKSDSIDDLNDFINEIAEISGNEAYNVDLGFEENSGTLQQLTQLLVLREQWHDLAETSAKVVGVIYKPRSLEELMAAEKQRTVGDEAVVNLEILAKMATRKTPERYEQVLEMLVKGQANKYKRQHETRVLTAPAVANIFSVADYRRNDAEVSFHQLADDAQHRLVLCTKSATERALSDLADWKGVTQIAYAQLCAEGFDLIDLLEEVSDRLGAKLAG